MAKNNIKSTSYHINGEKQHQYEGGRGGKMMMVVEARTCESPSHEFKDTRPPMLDRIDFASWQQQIRLYCQGKKNGVNILKYIDKGPYRMGTVRETLAESTEGAPQFGLERPLEYSDLTPEEKDRLHLNSKFMNNMLPEWGRFVTAVKLNKGLRDSNYDQLYAYLKKHETHAQENKMMLERFSQPTLDPLALMSNVSNLQHSSSIQVPQPIADSSLSPAENLIENLTNTLALLTQSYKTFLPQTNNQLRTSSNARNQDTGGNAARYGGAQNRVGNVNPGQARPGQARPVKCYNCNGIGYIARNCGQDNAFDDDVDEQPIQDLALNLDNMFQADDCDAFESDVDEAPTTQTMFMANLSSADPVTDEAGPSYDSDILSEYVKDNEVPVVHSDVSSVTNVCLFV
nr:hypothetical protein [Tanacetum cinerariifolium]